MRNLLKDNFNQKISNDQCKDSGMALTLIFIILSLFTKNTLFNIAAIGSLVLTMTAASILKPFAKLWIGISLSIGTVVSKIILSIVFIVFVTPVAALRRILGKDTLKLKEFKKAKTSVMEERNITFGPGDIERPY